MPRNNKPPQWILWLFAIMMLLWPALMYWLPNHYSGWSELRRYHKVSEEELRDFQGTSRGRTHVTLIQASGRKYNFESTRSGQLTFPRTEAGFDDEGFWIKGVNGGWTGGPRGAVFIPWSVVNRCEILRVELFYPEMSLLIQDQPLLDACYCKVMQRC